MPPSHQERGSRVYSRYSSIGEHKKGEASTQKALSGQITARETITRACAWCLGVADALSPPKKDQVQLSGLFLQDPSLLYYYDAKILAHLITLLLTPLEIASGVRDTLIFASFKKRRTREGGEGGKTFEKNGRILACEHY